MPSENPSATGRRLIPAMTDGAMHIQDALMHKAMAWALRNAVVSKGNVLALISQLDDSPTFNVRAVDVVPWRQRHALLSCDRQRELSEPTR